MEFIDSLLGLKTEHLQSHQMAARAFIMFFIGLVFIRISGVRMLGNQSAFDTLTILMLGAIMGRSIVTNQSLAGSICAALVLILLHRFVAWLTFKSHDAGKILKGQNVLMIKDGKKIIKNLSREHITEEDIMRAVRKDCHTTTLDDIKEVHLERTGEISIIKKESV